MNKTMIHRFTEGLHLLVIAALLAGLALGLSPVPLAQAATITVTNTNDSGVGSLRQAIDDAIPGDTINFAVTGTIALTSGELTINKNLTITGPGADQLTISGNNASRVITTTAGITVTISSVTIANGDAGAEDGGGIYNQGTLTLNNCTISDNSAHWDGGGIYNSDGDVTLTNCTVSGNTADDGGGGILNSGVMTLTNCTVSGNTAMEEEGGGIYNGEDMTLTNCTVSGNITTDDEGGGIYNSEDMTLTNCTVSGNTADAAGGGIYNAYYMTLTNCTVSGNITTDDEGGGIYNDEDTDFKNTIIANNTATDQGPDCGGDDLDSYGYNLVEDTSNCTIFEEANPGTNITGQDPNLGPLADNGGPSAGSGQGPTFTHALLPGSPAIDATSCKDMNNNDVTQDQRGIARPQPAGGNCDIGAYEAEPGTIIVEKQTDPDGAAGSFSFSGGVAGTISDGQQIVASVSPGSYAVVEDDPNPAFVLTAITCDDGGSATPSTWDVGTRTATINLDEKETVTCTFTNTRQYLLTVIKAGAGAAVRAQAEGWSGTVTSDPAGIYCGSDCAEHYLKDTVVTLTAHPGVKSYLAGWDGDCVSTGTLTAQVTMDADKTCTATFGYPIGGIAVPVDRLGLLAPWMGLAALALFSALTVALVRRRKT